jgi:hypothetical protein
MDTADPVMDPPCGERSQERAELTWTMTIRTATSSRLESGTGVLRVLSRGLRGLRGLATVCCVMPLAACETEQEVAPSSVRTFGDIQLQEVRAPNEGMDVEFWVTDLSSAGLGRALAPLSSTMLGGKTAEVWRSNGLRIYRVASTEGKRVAASLPMQGQVRRDALPMLERWTPLATGRRWNDGLDIWLDQQNWGDSGASSALMVSMGKLSLTPGSLRLLARNWVVAGTVDPLAGGQSGGSLPAAMLVQLVPQHAESRRSGPSDLFTGPTLSSPREDGQVFDRLSIELVCEPGEMLLIVPVHPREELVESTQRGSPAQEASEATGPSTIQPVPLIEPKLIDESAPASAQDGPASQNNQPSTAGPKVPDLLTLGEAMLTDATFGKGARRRVIIAITPRVPDRFEPLGPAPAPPATAGESNMPVR